jgi:hypothetical protein
MESSGILTRRERLAEAATPPQPVPTTVDLSSRTDYRFGGGHYNHTTHDFNFLYQRMRDFAEFEAEVNQQIAWTTQIFELFTNNPLVSSGFAIWSYTFLLTILISLIKKNERKNQFI